MPEQCIQIIKRYPDMASDLYMGKRFTDCMHTEYFVPGQGHKTLSKNTIARVTQAIKDAEEMELDIEEAIEQGKEKIARKKSLSGLDTPRVNTPGPGRRAMDIPGTAVPGTQNPYTPYLPANVQSGGDPLSATEVQALVENATLRNENRHLQEKLDELRDEKAKLEQTGLSGLNLNTDHKFLQRDYAALKEKYDTMKADYDDAIKERDQLRKDSEWEEKLARIAELPGMDGIIRSLGDKLLGAGMQQPQLQQLSGTPAQGIAQAQWDAMNDEEKYAFSFGVFAMENLSQEDLKEFSMLIQIVGKDRSQMVKVRNFINKIVEEFQKKSDRRAAATLEETDERSQHAQSL